MSSGILLKYLIAFNITAPADVTRPVIVNVDGVDYAVNMTNGFGQLNVTGLDSGSYGDRLRYMVMYPPIGDIIYNSNGTLSFSSPSNEEKSSSDITVSGATINVPSGLYASSVSKTVASGTAGTPTATKGTVSNNSVNVTPSVTNTTGYITGSTKTGTAVTVSASELVSGNKSITSNGNNIDVANYSTVSVNVSGGGGDSKNAQAVQGDTRTTSSTATAIGAEMTVSKTGTYDVYWSGYRTNTSGSYTYGTQLYIDGVAYGTENTTWYYHIQNNHLQNVSLTQGQKIRVRGRNSRGSSYYIYAPTLVIVET